MLDDRRLLRRVTLSLAGRLPTDAGTRRRRRRTGSKALPAAPRRADEGGRLLRPAPRGVQRHLPHARRRRQRGARPSSPTSTSRRRGTGTQKYDLSHITDEKERQQAGYKLADDYRKALLGEPMKLIEHIVRNDRPFTEIVTADYIMVTPYTARGYGIFDEVKAQFKNPDDPFEYIPVKLKALDGPEQGGRTRSRRPASTRTPGCSARSSTCAATRRPRRTATACARGCTTSTSSASTCWNWPPASRTPRRSRRSIQIPTMQASECVVCHKTLDPVAGLFQDYWQFGQGVYGKRKGGWFKDMFAAGFEGEDLPADGALAGAAVARRADREGPALRRRDGRARLLHPHRPQGAAAAEGPRRPALRRQAAGVPGAAPPDRGDRRALRQVRASTSRTSSRTGSSPTSTAPTAWRPRSNDPSRRAELDDVGPRPDARPGAGRAEGGRRLRRAVGQAQRPAGDALRRHRLQGSHRARRPTRAGRWGRSSASWPTTWRASTSLRDFARPPPERRLFPGIEPDVLPGASPEADAAIRQAIVHLHERDPGPLRRRRTPRRSTRTFDLFAGIVADAEAAEGPRQARELRLPGQTCPTPPDDPHYTIRAWRGVVTYLLRRPEFLYE